MNGSSVPDLERILFYSGQQLQATDLTELVRARREMLWLHTRSLHSWGIGIGFGVGGKRGDSVVSVSPGYGVDCLGREILLSEARTLTVPAVAGTATKDGETYYLVAAYQDDAAQSVAERRSGVCLPEGTVRLSEEPLIAWRPQNELRDGLDVVLAQGWIQNCQLSKDVSLLPRRYARASEQPYVATGQTAAGATDWQIWWAGAQAVGIFVAVDTSAAGFHATPRYIAHVVGDRYLDAAPGPLIALGVPAVEAADRNGFTLRVLLPDVLGGAAAINPAAVRVPANVSAIFNQLNWQVVWLGIEA